MKKWQGKAALTWALALFGTMMLAQGIDHAHIFAYFSDGFCLYFGWVMVLVGLFIAIH